MDLFDNINVSRRRSQLHKEPRQDLGAGFKFSEDADSLNSILSNKGISQAQRNKLNQDNLSHQLGGQEEKYEFFQGHGGHMFFRRKLVSTANKTGVTSTTTVPPTAGSSNKVTASKEPMQMPVRFGSKKKLQKFATSSRKENDDPNCLSEKKKRGVELFVAPHRQSISERKPVRRRSELPKPSNFSGARKGLNFDKGKEMFKKPFTPCTDKVATRGGGGENAPKFPLEPLRRLDRDSMKLLPRDSLAWINHLPRDSATFLELERLMHDKDKDLLREDDTGSFEAMELRLKTPRKVTKEAVNTDVQSDSEEKSPEAKNPFAEELSSNENKLDTCDRQETNDEEEVNPDKDNDEADTDVTPPKNRFKVMLTLTPTFNKEVIPKRDSTEAFVPKADFIKGDLLEDLENMPLNAQLATPTIKSQSMSDLNKEDKEPKEVQRSVSDEMLGSKVEEVSSLVSLQQLQQALHEMEDMRRQQEELDRMQEQLFARIRERKQSFKTLWGVSPMSVNKTRTVINKETKMATSESSKPQQLTGQTESLSEAEKAVDSDDSTVDASDYVNSDTVRNMSINMKGLSTVLDTPSLTGMKPLTGSSPGLESSLSKRPDEGVQCTPEMTVSMATTTRNNTLLNTEMKRVRFDSGENRAKFMTPDTEIVFQPRPASENVTAKSSKSCEEKSADQSKYARRSLNSQSFVSLKSSFSFLQTPGGAANKCQSVLPATSENTSRDDNKIGLPTPMALKSLSARIKEEYALLYADDEDEGGEEEGEETEDEEGEGEEEDSMEMSRGAGDFMKKLKF